MDPMDITARAQEEIEYLVDLYKCVSGCMEDRDYESAEHVMNKSVTEAWLRLTLLGITEEQVDEIRKRCQVSLRPKEGVESSSEEGGVESSSRLPDDESPDESVTEMETARSKRLVAEEEEEVATVACRQKRIRTGIVSSVPSIHHHGQWTASTVRPIDPSIGPETMVDMEECAEEESEEEGDEARTLDDSITGAEEELEEDGVESPSSNRLVTARIKKAARAALVKARKKQQQRRQAALELSLADKDGNNDGSSTSSSEDEDTDVSSSEDEDSDESSSEDELSLIHI